MTPKNEAESDPMGVVAVVLSEMVGMNVPRLKRLADSHVPELQSTLWPDGDAPDVVTWTLLHERQIELLERSAKEIVASDIAIAAERGTPWPSGSSIRRETAVRVGITSSLVDKAHRLDFKSLIDLMLFRDRQEIPEKFSLGDLIQTTAALLLRLSRAIRERDTGIATPEIAGVLGRLFRELMVAMVGLFHLVDDVECAELAQKMAALARPLLPLCQ